MTKVAEILSNAVHLDEAERETLAFELLSTLPGPPQFEDDEHGLVEAIRRSEEMDKKPEIAVSWEEIKASLGR